MEPLRSVVFSEDLNKNINYSNCRKHDVSFNVLMVFLLEENKSRKS